MNHIDFDALVKELNNTKDNEDAKPLQNLSFLANIDPLTRVYNYAFFQNQLSLQWKIAGRQKSSLALFKVSVNDFQNFCLLRDARTKDYVLQKVAKCLKLLFRRGTDFVARDNGDQFLILVIDMDTQRVESYKDIIIERVNSLKIAHNEINKFLSVAVHSLVYFPKHDESYELALDALFLLNE